MVIRSDSSLKQIKIIWSLITSSNSVKKVSLSFVISLSMVGFEVDDLKHFPTRLKKVGNVEVRIRRSFKAVPSQARFELHDVSKREDGNSTEWNVDPLSYFLESKIKHVEHVCFDHRDFINDDHPKVFKPFCNLSSCRLRNGGCCQKRIQKPNVKFDLECLRLLFQ